MPWCKVLRRLKRTPEYLAKCLLPVRIKFGQFGGNAWGKTDKNWGFWSTGLISIYKGSADKNKASGRGLITVRIKVGHPGVELQCASVWTRHVLNHLSKWSDVMDRAWNIIFVVLSCIINQMENSFSRWYFASILWTTTSQSTSQIHPTSI